MMFDILVEGPTDEIVARKILSHCGYQAGTAFGKKGINYIFEKIDGFNVLAQKGIPILALVDFMDTNLGCPPEVKENILPHCSSKMVIRVVVRELESWLIADECGLASYLGISVRRIPREPEMLNDPKQTLVNLARRARNKLIRESIVPVQGVSSMVGAGYVSAIDEFVKVYWNIENAKRRSNSLRRCLNRLQNFKSDSD